MVSLFAVVLIIHYIADFVFQTNEMALRKSTSIGWLTWHVAAYMGVLGFLFGLFLLFAGAPYAAISAKMLICWWLFNGVTHWLVDFFSSKASSYYWKQQRPHAFFVVIGGDQLVHLLLLLWSTSRLL